MRLSSFELHYLYDGMNSITSDKPKKHMALMSEIRVSIGKINL